MRVAQTQTSHEEISTAACDDARIAHAPWPVKRPGSRSRQARLCSASHPTLPSRDQYPAAAKHLRVATHARYLYSRASRLLTRLVRHNAFLHHEAPTPHTAPPNAQKAPAPLHSLQTPATHGTQSLDCRASPALH